jgi:hypothetical protein
VTLFLKRPASGGELHLGIPAILESTFEIAGEFSVIPHSSAWGALEIAADGTLRGQLGGTSILSLNPADVSQQAGADLQPVITGEAVSLVEIHPLRARIRTRLAALTLNDDSSSSNKTSHGLVLWLPGGADVREVASQNLLAYSAWSPSDDQTLLELDFNAPFEAGREILLDFTIPLRERDGSVVLPAIPLLGESGLRSHRIGMRAVRGFLLTASAQSESVQELPADLFEIPDERAWPAPDAAYLATAPVILTARLERIEPTRTFAWEQTLVVREDRADWTVTATIDIAGTPAYLHRLRIGEAARVESVSLAQDGADRLLTWSKEGEELVLNVQSETVGRQELTVRGRLPRQVDASIEVPPLSIAGAEPASAEVIVENSTSSVIEFLGAGGAAMTDQLPAMGRAPSAGPPMRRFSMPRDVLPAALQLVAPPDPPAVARVLTLIPARDHWQLSQTFSGDALPIPFRLRVPRSLASTIQLEPGIISNATGDIDATEGNGTVDLELRPAADGPWTRTTLSFPVRIPADRHWDLPAIVPIDVRNSGNWLFLPADAPVEVDAADAIPINAEAIPPEALTAAPPAVAAGTRIYELQAFDPGVIVRRVAAEAFSLPFCESFIWHEAPARVAGRSRWYVVAQQPEFRVEINVPREARLALALWNGEDRTPPEAAGPLISIPSGPVSVGSVHCLELEWYGRAQVASWSESIDRPVSAEIIPGQDLVTLVAADDRFSHAAGSTASAGKFGLIRLEAQLSAAAAVPREGPATPGLSIVLRDIRSTLGALSSLSLSDDEARRLANAQIAWLEMSRDRSIAPPAETRELRADERSAWPLDAAWTEPGALLLRMPANAPRVQTWTIRREVGLAGASALLVAAAVAIVLGRRRFRIASSLSPAANSYAGLVLAGLCWWLWFPASAAGLLLALLALVLQLGTWYRRLGRERPAAV